MGRRGPAGEGPGGGGAAGAARELRLSLYPAGRRWKPGVEGGVLLPRGRGGSGPAPVLAEAAKPRRQRRARNSASRRRPGSLRSLLYLRALSILSDVSRVTPNRRSSLVRTMEGPRPIDEAAALAVANEDGAVFRVMLPALRV